MEKENSTLTTWILCVVILLGLCFLGACSSRPVPIPERQATHELINIKQAAVVAFGVDGVPSYPTNSEATAVQVFEELNQNLEQNLKWQMLPLLILQHHPGYQEVRKTRAEATGRSAQAPGIMSPESLHALSVQERDHLLRELQVDALVVAKVSLAPSGGGAVLGIGSGRPHTAVMFQVFKKGQVAPVWSENEILGFERIRPAYSRHAQLGRKPRSSNP